MKKKILLFAGLLFAGSGFTQVDSSFAPDLGALEVYTVYDSAATAYDGVTGTNAVWDYSQITDYSGLKDTVEVIDPAQTKYDTSFTQSARSFFIHNFFMTYYKTPKSTKKQETGFVFINSDSTIPINDIVVVFDSAVTTMEHPMQLNDQVVAQFKGEASVTITANPTNPATITPLMTGSATITLDGKGTLKLGSAVYDSVYRYKIVEKAKAFVVAMNDTAHFNRVQYEYYDYSLSKLPVMIHSKATFALGAATLIDVHPVLGREIGSAGIKENKTVSFTVFPNPANQKVFIQGDYSGAQPKVNVLDNLGRIVYQGILDSQKKAIDVSMFHKGIYFVRVIEGGKITTKKLIIK